jgi:hypothetical protein
MMFYVKNDSSLDGLWRYDEVIALAVSLSPVTLSNKRIRFKYHAMYCQRNPVKERFGAIYEPDEEMDRSVLQRAITMACEDYDDLSQTE